MAAINNWNRGFEVPLEEHISFKGLESHFRRSEHHIVCKINCKYKIGMTHLNSDVKFTVKFAVLCLARVDPCKEVRKLPCSNRTEMVPVKFSSVYQP